MAKSGGFAFDRRGFVAAALASVALVACGDAPEAGEGAVVAAAVDGAIEKPNLKFGFIKLTDMAPLAIAKEKGYFAEEGLNVTLEPQANWKVLLDGVIGGQLDGAHMLAGQPLAATIGYGTKADLIAPLSLDLNGNAITLSNKVWDMIKADLPKGPDGKPVHPISAEVLKPVVASFEQAGEPVAASSVTLAGGVTPVGGGDPADPGGGNPCIALVTPEQIWTAVADSIESELVTPGTVHDVFDDTLDLAITCCWPRCFHHAPLPWGPGPNGCTPWDNWKDTPLANGCIGEASWRRDREELQWRHATWTSITCVKTTMWQSRIRTRRECTTTEWDTLGAAYCIDEPARPNVKTAPPVTFPGPFCSVPGNPFATSGWTPRCIPW